MRILAAPDKFRGTAMAAEVAEAIARSARDLGHVAETLPTADGGEGTLEALGGPTETLVVSGPDGQPREVCWRLAEGTAVIETARASGLALLPDGTNNSITATSSRQVSSLPRHSTAAPGRWSSLSAGPPRLMEG